MSISINILNNWKAILEIIILWIVFYQIMLFFKGTRAIQVLRTHRLSLCFFIFQILRLETLDWLMTHFCHIGYRYPGDFSTEIRQGLAKLGQQKIFKGGLYEEELKEIIAQIVSAVDILSRKKIGALIAIEKEDSLREYIENGVKIDSRISAELIQTIFTPNSLLHDGGLIIQNTG